MKKSPVMTYERQPAFLSAGIWQCTCQISKPFSSFKGRTCLSHADVRFVRWQSFDVPSAYRQR